MAKKVLLVNDDGIFHPAFVKTIECFKQLGYEITICAPINQQSAKSHAIEIRDAFEVKRIYDYEGIDAYAIDSTPADCVRFAKYYLKWQGDLVVSGVNNGLNLGDDILYSGTVAAACEAGLRGYNAIALSGEYGNPDSCINQIKNILDFIKKEKLFDKWSIWSFNVPSNPKGFKMTNQGDVFFDTYFEEIKENYFVQLGMPHHELEKDPNTDVAAYEAGFISYSAISTSRTCSEKLKSEQMKQKC